MSIHMLEEYQTLSISIIHNEKHLFVTGQTHNYNALTALNITNYELFLPNKTVMCHISI